MGLINLSAEQQWRCRPGEQTCMQGDEGEGGPSGESSMRTCTSPRVKQLASGHLLCDPGSSHGGV